LTAFGKRLVERAIEWGIQVRHGVGQ
jgi:hypothetical protein